jgi:tetratricopeptide (TPR) repeat protein
LAFQRAGDWKSETSLWTSAVRADPDNAFAWMALAESRRAGGDATGNAQALRTGLTKNPSFHLAFAGLNNLAEASLDEGRPGAARRFAEKALRIQPQHPAALHNRNRAEEALRRGSPPR